MIKSIINKRKLNSFISVILAVVVAMSITGCSMDTLDSDSSTNTESTISTESGTDENSSSVTEVEDSSTSDSSQESSTSNKEDNEPNPPVVNTSTKFNIKDIPAFSNKSYVAVNNNNPYFTDSDYTTKSYERYSDLDGKGRCGVAVACIGKELMPTEGRGSIGQVKPTGWQTVKYDCVDGKYLYNRCHLIGFQLSGENANTKNLITGTRYMNVDGMLPFENMVTDYVKETGNHVLYRVTPIFEGENLVATGVLMEAYSVEDNGDGICFNVFCYNSQPQIKINYADGSSQQIGGGTSNEDDKKDDTPVKPDNPIGNKSSYVLNTNTKKFHYPDCSSVKKMSVKNRKDVTDTRESIIAQGYEPCGNCHP